MDTVLRPSYDLRSITLLLVTPPIIISICKITVLGPGNHTVGVPRDLPHPSHFSYDYGMKDNATPPVEGPGKSLILFGDMDLQRTCTFYGLMSLHVCISGWRCHR